MRAAGVVAGEALDRIQSCTQLQAPGSWLRAESESATLRALFVIETRNVIVPVIVAARVNGNDHVAVIDLA